MLAAALVAMMVVDLVDHLAEKSADKMVGLLEFQTADMMVAVSVEY